MPPPPFTSEYAYQVLDHACQAVGMVAEGATMLRLGENAIFRLADRFNSIVVRVTRDLSRLEIARRELCVSRWPLLTDFEVCATGPREWDLIPLAVGVDRLGLPPARWEEFVTTYGFDVRAWSGYPLFREARELGMTTWLAQNAAESPAIADEFRLRIQSLRDGDLNRAWTAF